MGLSNSVALVLSVIGGGLIGACIALLMTWLIEGRSK